MTLIKRLAAAIPLALGLSLAQANEAGYPLDHFPTSKLTEQAALQDGARTFVNYCLNCHGSSSMRYNRLTDLGLTEDQIRKNLMFAADKVGEQMKTALSPADAKAWFGALPPDLSVIARARASEAGSGPDWLYTYLRAYYRDATRPTGWNNALFPNVGMPHIFWELQGTRGATIEEIKASGEHGFTKTVVSFDVNGQRTEKTTEIKDGHPHEGRTITLGKPQGGQLDQARYDESVANLVAYVTYMSDPSARTRTRMGVWVLIFLGFLTVFAWWLNREYWKDVK
jgi:ubiquinol-cytochrome c reductase cytochrome c1 subunit